MTTPDAILAYWLDEAGPQKWYAGKSVDAEIREKFLATWKNAAEGGCSLWLTYPSGSLAYIILTDQFPRNMFRDTARAFSTDGAARAAAKMAIERGWDMKIDEPARQFFYMPLVHSECLVDQDRSVRLIQDRMPATGGPNLLHARAHREIIRQFGRFPFRNAALERATKASEAAFLESGGYPSIVEALKEAA